MNHPQNKRRGYSMLELLVVVAIMMTLAAVATISYKESQLRARETAAIQHMQTLQKAATRSK